MFTGEYISPVL